MGVEADTADITFSGQNDQSSSQYIFSRCRDKNMYFHEFFISAQKTHPTHIFKINPIIKMIPANDYFTNICFGHTRCDKYPSGK